jgi:hypothetical protein
MDGYGLYLGAGWREGRRVFTFSPQFPQRWDASERTALGLPSHCNGKPDKKLDLVLR